jgi:hypothetical protein
MTPEQSRATEAILNMLIKALFAICALVGWFIVLFRWLDAKTSFDLYKYGSMEFFLSATIFLVFRHYFGFIRRK